MQTHTQNIVERLVAETGSFTKLAELIGVHKSRPHYWTLPKSRGGTEGKIPAMHHGKVLELSKKYNWGIKPEDLIDDFYFN